MKRLIVFTLIALLSMPLWGQESRREKNRKDSGVPENVIKEVDSPEFYGRNSVMFKIDKIYFTPTETVLKVTVGIYDDRTMVQIPAGAVLRDPESNRVYALKGAKGFPVGEYKLLPGGTATFSIIFEPVDPTARIINYEENIGKTDFSVYGIRLSGKKFTQPFRGKGFKYYPETNTMVVANNMNETSVSEIPASVLSQSKGLPLNIISVAHLY